MSLIQVERLSVRYGARTALSDVSLRIAANEIVTIVGPNGSGKTSLLRAIIGAIQPSAGRIVHADNLKIGYVPQKLHIDDTLPITVSRFLKLPGGVAGADVEYALKEAAVPELEHAQLSQLSGGQFQRVLLARALIGRPNLLLLDEATQGLDQRGSASFYQQIETVRQATFQQIPGLVKYRVSNHRKCVVDLLEGPERFLMDVAGFNTFNQAFAQSTNMATL